jgi:hypothetical protein
MRGVAALLAQLRQLLLAFTFAGARSLTHGGRRAPGRPVRAGRHARHAGVEDGAGSAAHGIRRQFSSAARHCCASDAHAAPFAVGSGGASPRRCGHGAAMRAAAAGWRRPARAQRSQGRRRPRPGFLQHARGGGDALHNLRAEHRRVIQAGEAGLQGQQMAGQIAAVHRRDVHRLQRLEVCVSYQL